MLVFFNVKPGNPDRYRGQIVLLMMKITTNTDHLLKKLGIDSATVSQDELEDIGMSKLLRQVDKTKKASRSEIMKKLSA